MNNVLGWCRGRITNKIRVHITGHGIIAVLIVGFDGPPVRVHASFMLVVTAF